MVNLTCPYKQKSQYYLKYKIRIVNISFFRLSGVKRKTLVLDLDETLIHSQHDGLGRAAIVKPGFYSIKFWLHIMLNQR